MTKHKQWARGAVLVAMVFGLHTGIGTAIAAKKAAGFEVRLIIGEVGKAAPPKSKAKKSIVRKLRGSQVLR